MQGYLPSQARVMTQPKKSSNFFLYGHAVIVPNLSTNILSENLLLYRCQEGLLDQMVLGPNIAKNAALRENVFMMAICIELRIPLFLVGKPGSSKSLAKSIIQDSMHGQASQTPLLRRFKQVILHTVVALCVYI